MTHQPPWIPLSPTIRLSTVSFPQSTARRALLPLALGGFAVGTTELSSMSLLPQVSAGLGAPPHLEEETLQRAPVWFRTTKTVENKMLRSSHRLRCLM